MAQNAVPCITRGENIVLRAVWEGELIAIDILSMLRRCDGDALIRVLRIPSFGRHEPFEKHETTA
jgi:hypothetical protein